jgi:hypothetical protein
VSDIVIRMTIPLVSAPIVSVPGLCFSRWLPTKDDDPITVQDSDWQLALWWDVSCTISPPGVEDPAEFAGHVNVPTSEIKAEIIVHCVGKDLWTFLVESGKKGKFLPEGPLRERAEKLGKKIHEVVLGRVNRLVSYARTYKGQYWLEEYPIRPGMMQSDFTGFGAQLKTPEGQWCNFRPTDTIHTTALMIDEARYISKADWSEVKAFVQSTSKPSLVLHLLTTAEAFAGAGHNRAALIEAVTALEIAINEFAKRPTSGILCDAVMTRGDIPSLPRQVEKLGLRGTIRYLLPVILSPQAIASSVFKNCQEAVDERNSVVHHGQRNVTGSKLDGYLRHIRQMCAILAGQRDLPRLQK